MKSIGQIASGLTLALLLAAAEATYAQEDATPKDAASPFPMKATDMSEVRRLSDEQLAAFVKILGATPTLSWDVLPRKGSGGTFYSLQHPEWPALPGDAIHAAVWPMEDFYLLNDVDYPYNTAPPKSASGLMAPGDGGEDTNTFEFTSEAQMFTTNDLWLQFANQSNFISSLVIHTPWDVTGSNFMFDVFATTNLRPNVPGLNWTNWLFVTRSVPGQTNLTVSPLPGAPVCFYRLGTMQDSDNDGLTDAFEKLVSHTDPNLWDSNGNGIGDGDEISPSGLPWRLMQVRPSSVVIFANAPVATQGGACGYATVYLPTPAPTGGTTVQYYLGGTAGLNSDYSLSPAANSLFIPAGYSNGTITVCALGTNTYSDLDLYTDITLTNANGYYVDGSPAHISIIDTGSPGIRVFALPPWVRRPCDTYGTNEAGFYFIRDGDSTNALTIGLSYAGGTATTNGDYSALPKLLAFPANVRTNWLPITLMTDSTNPADKTLVLTITNAPGYQIDPTNGTATVTIAATAAPVLPVVTITNSIPFASTGTPGQFTITRSFATASPLRVYFNSWSSVENVTGRAGSTL